MGRVRVREEKESAERRSGKRKSQKKENAGARKGRKTAKHSVFSKMLCGSGSSKSRLTKAAGAELSGQMSDQKLHAAVAQSRFRSQNARVP